MTSALAVAASFSDCHVAFRKAKWQVRDRYWFVSPDGKTVVRYAITTQQVFGIDRGSTVYVIDGFETNRDALAVLALARRRGLVLRDLGDAR